MPARGDAYRKKGELDKAVADYTDAIRLDPKDAAAHAARGDVYRKKGELNKAIADYTEAIRLDPKNAAAHAARGVAYRMEAESDKAIADYIEVINPQDAEAYAMRGEQGDFDKAIADCTEAIRLDPKWAEAYYDRGSAYEKKGDKAKAEADFAQAKKLGYKGK